MNPTLAPPPAQLLLPWDDAWLLHHERCGAKDLAHVRQRITARIDHWLQSVSALVCEDAVDQANGRYESFLRRVSACLHYHWIDLALERPQRFEDVWRVLQPSHLKETWPAGRVLAEVILAQALESGEDRAATRFELDYMPRVRGLAFHLGGERAVDAVENFAAELVLPRGDRPPRIATYLGKTPLANWLAPVVANYWRTELRHKPMRPLAAVPEPCAAAPEGSAEASCEGLLRPIFRASVQALPADDRLLLRLLALDGVPQKQIAAKLGLHSGTLTRRRQKATDAVWHRLRELANSGTDARQVEECLYMLLSGHDPELRSRLADVLAAGVRGE